MSVCSSYVALRLRVLLEACLCSSVCVWYVCCVELHVHCVLERTPRGNWRRDSVWLTDRLLCNGLMYRVRGWPCVVVIIASIWLCLELLLFHSSGSLPGLLLHFNRLYPHRPASNRVQGIHYPAGSSWKGWLITPGTTVEASARPVDRS